MWWRILPDRLDCRAAVVRGLSSQRGNDQETICRKCAQRHAAETQPDLELANPHRRALITVTGASVGADRLPERFLTAYPMTSRR
jgi:hypothetical protein